MRRALYGCMYRYRYAVALLCAAATIVCGVSRSHAQPDVEIGFKESWAVSSGAVNFSRYQTVQILTLDLRKLKLLLTDEDGLEYEEGINSRVLESIAAILYDRFKEKLNEVLPVVDHEKPSEEEYPLFIDLKLSGTFAAEERRLLMDFIHSRFNLPTKTMTLSLDCVLFDSVSGKEILTVSDSQPFTSTDNSDPFVSQQDREEFSRLVDLWARRLANFLTNQRQPHPTVLK